MSEDSEADGKLQLDSLRSPCKDAHYEAFIIQSKWTVDNLYASNVNLGQEYVKRIRLMEREKKTWLLGKCKEQQKVEKKMRELETAQRRATVSAADRSHREFRWRLNPSSVKQPSRHESLERLTPVGLTPPLPKNPMKTRSVSQPFGPTGVAFCARPENMQQLRQNNAAKGAGQIQPRFNTLPAQPQFGSSKMSVYSETAFRSKRRSFSVSTPSLTSRYAAPEEAHLIDTKLIPKYVPSKLRSRRSTLF